MGIDYGISFELQDVNAKKWVKKSSTKLVSGTNDYVNGMLKRSATSGIEQGKSIEKISTDIQSRLTSTSKTSATRTARTIMTAAGNGGKLDSFKAAEKMGIDVQKQWVSTLDTRTRNSHIWLDGTIVDTNKKFPNGLKYPGDSSGSAAEVYNCRCTMRAYMPDIDNTSKLRWSKTADGTYSYTTSKTYQQWAKEKGITLQEKPKTFTAVKNKTRTAAKKTTEKVVEQLTKVENVVSKLADLWGVEYNQVQKRTESLTEQQIIDRISGGDLTEGSCASLAYTYVGQKAGYDVLDFRDGVSRKFFSARANSSTMSQFEGVKSYQTTGRTSYSAAKEMLKNVEVGKEYVLHAGAHAAVIKREANGTLKYLELQSGYSVNNGWRYFDESGSNRNTLRWRFGCNLKGTAKSAYMVDVDSLANSKEFSTVLGYINTPAGQQKKGSAGHER